MLLPVSPAFKLSSTEIWIRSVFLGSVTESFKSVLVLPPAFFQHWNCLSVVLFLTLRPFIVLRKSPTGSADLVKVRAFRQGRPRPGHGEFRVQVFVTPRVSNLFRRPLSVLYDLESKTNASKLVS